jgi:hypothetical protein
MQHLERVSPVLQRIDDIGNALAPVRSIARVVAIDDDDRALAALHNPAAENVGRTRKPLLPKCGRCARCGRCGRYGAMRWRAGLNNVP